MPASFQLAAWRVAILSFVLPLFAAAIGCSQSDRVPVYPVEGQLSFNGAPLSNAFVVLHPRAPTDKRVLAARAQTDAAGKFQVTTYEQADGAAEGEYAITVESFKPIKTANGLEPGPNILPPKFARPDSSGITVTVAKGKNTLDPISLK